ncbi:type II toxin-antitoxin system prevent-host-death family antitoxin [Spiribacter sp. 2438]|uniref:type II toxin-antitoxin system Phd/YefM family antitoxin n=1 Tax=Spiribacter sp. 2438 TaxID=2666185 RepID=UPI0012B0C294|nr:type II toxin-antitoxin system prevent-host-death family antitoxin [Spiribacter sp. 2438]QGM21164.1 type II toxin-antitoxin system prevent-host-death family antitoxin [Spiribacter sp. 2438]
MKEVNVRDARENFASLLRQIEQGGEEITILRHGKPVARMTRVEAQDAVPFISRISLREGIPPMQETAADTVRALREEDERG